MIECVSQCPKAIERLKVAFRACPTDFKLLKSEIKAGRVSVYQLQGDNLNLTIAGEVLDDSYYLWGVVGRGVVSGIRELTQYVRRSGLSSISAETYFDGLARLVRPLDTSEQTLQKTTRLEMRV